MKNWRRSMQNRKLRHLFVRTDKGRYYIPTDLWRGSNTVELIESNEMGARAFMRLGNMNAAKYFKALLSGKPITFK